MQDFLDGLIAQGYFAALPVQVVYAVGIVAAAAIVISASCSTSPA